MDKLKQYLACAAEALFLGADRNGADRGPVNVGLGRLGLADQVQR